MTELLIRRRVRRVLVLCPASLRQQWQEEMRNKFALTFDVVDRPETHALQKTPGSRRQPVADVPQGLSPPTTTLSSRMCLRAS